jgi:Zn-dependent protease with chaperone function
VSSFSSSHTVTTSTDRSDQPITVQPWPSERPLFVVSVVTAAVLWIVLLVTMIGAVYALIFALLFGLIHIIFVAQVRGNAVRLGPDQFPDLYASVERMARRMGMSRTPETYLMQAGGSLNAFATKFLRSNIVVLFSDLLDACGHNTAARDMIIAHELGHIKSGHLRWRWFLMPASFVPFLTSALSRAREYTCDRYGLAGAGNKEGAGLGLAILAAGAKHGPLVNRVELVRQQAAVSRSGFMTLGEWFGSHPPLAKRLAQIDPELAVGAPVSRHGAARAVLALGALPAATVVIFAAVAASGLGDAIRRLADSPSGVQQTGTSRSGTDSTYTPPPDATERARTDIARLAEFIEQERARGVLPWNSRELYRRLQVEYPTAKGPSDPFDGTDYGYEQRGDHFLVWSSGPDGESWTDDDLRYDSRLRRIVVASETGSRR